MKIFMKIVKICPKSPRFLVLYIQIQLRDSAPDVQFLMNSLKGVKYLVLSYKNRHFEKCRQAAKHQLQHVATI